MYPSGGADPRYDPEQAELSLSRLAATTDAELAGDIRAAAAEVVTTTEAWRQSTVWRGDTFERGLLDHVPRSAMRWPSYLPRRAWTP